MCFFNLSFLELMPLFYFKIIIFLGLLFQSFDLPFEVFSFNILPWSFTLLLLDNQLLSSFMEELQQIIEITGFQDRKDIFLTFFCGGRTTIPWWTWFHLWIKYKLNINLYNIFKIQTWSNNSNTLKTISKPTICIQL